MASIRQVDNVGGFTGTTGTFTYFEAEFGMVNVQAGDSLVVFVNTPDAESNVVSVSDNYGNSYEQVPGARTVLTPGPDLVGTPQMVDVWWAKNVAQVTDPGKTFSLTVTLDSVVFGWGTVIVDVEGISGASVVLGNVLDTSLISAISGPSLNGGAGAVFLEAVAAVGAGSGLGNNAPSPGSSVSSPWDIIVEPGITGGGGYAYVEGGNMAVASYVGSGVQQPTFTLIDSSIACVCGLAFVVDGSGGGTGPLSVNNVGDTLTDEQVNSIANPNADRGHIAYSTVYSGTLRNWNGLVGIIIADQTQGDAVLPTIHSGEGPLVRVQASDVTYSPSAGDRVKFMLYRTSAGDKLAKAVSLIS